MSIKNYLLIFTTVIISAVFLYLLKFQHTLGYQKENSDTWTLVATGDVMLGRSVNTQTIKQNDFTWAFQNLADILSQADVTIINLESPLIANCLQTDAGMVFCGSQKHLEGLQFAGVDIANLANNHILNYGQTGFQETVDLLENNGISALGFGRTVTKNIQGQKITFLGYSLLEKYNLEDIKKIISYYDQKSDVVIVSVHWGIEYQDKPTKSQIEIAHSLIDSGTDLIIGHHPHWVQTEEVYQGKHIFYSLGNTIFDQMWSDKTRQGLIVSLTFSGAKIINITRHPITIYHYGQPKLD